MVTKELLKEAAERYPVGTVIRSDYSNDIYKISSKTFSGDDDDIQGRAGRGAKPFVYYRGKWATIISLPEPKERRYELW